MEMLSNQSHLLGSVSTPLPGMLLVTKGKASQLWGNSWARWKLRGPPWQSSGLVQPFVQLKKKKIPIRSNPGGVSRHLGEASSIQTILGRRVCHGINPESKGSYSSQGQGRPSVGKWLWNRAMNPRRAQSTLQRRVFRVGTMAFTKAWGTRLPLCNMRVPLACHDLCSFPQYHFAENSVTGA